MRYLLYNEYDWSVLSPMLFENQMGKKTALLKTASGRTTFTYPAVCLLRRKYIQTEENKHLYLM